MTNAVLAKLGLAGDSLFLHPAAEFRWSVRRSECLCWDEVVRVTTIFEASKHFGDTHLPHHADGRGVVISWQTTRSIGR